MEKFYDNEQIRIRKKALLTGSLAHFIHDGFTDMLYIFFPIWQAQFSLNFTEIGFLKTLFSGTMACFQVPSTNLANRVGEIRLLLLGTILTSVSVWLLGWSATPIFLGCLLVVGGLGSSVQHPLSSSIISNAYTDSDARRVALSTFNVTGDMGKLVLPSVAAFLISQYNWPTTIHVLGIVGMGVVITIFLSSKSIRQVNINTENKKTTTAISHLKWKENKAFWSLSMIGVIDSATRMGFLTFFPFLLQEKGAGVTTIGLALSLVFAGGSVGKFVCGTLATKLGILRSVIITEIITAFCIWAMLNLPINNAILLAPILGVALNGTSSVLYGSVPELVSEERRKQAFAIFYTATIGAGALSPSIYGMASDIVGIKTVVIIVAIVVLFTIPLTIPLRGKI
ncbi:MFS transporter [Pelosinus sp. IPA-1]|uniref:MFS transporter n=1 Tax=Pelosinus sp. IPA-1 TaxID=3029569 RepID=UPI0024361745|nr:MFS transporter [Pelosinus sp. IPA-1]GMB02213.1 MFS transporter [Pelosinus sp. IPA-1]